MKKLFSTKWNSSTQPRKQRKFAAKAPLHIKQKFMGAHLSKELAKKMGTRSVTVRTGDKVKLMLGQFKGIEGKVERISRFKGKIYVTGCSVPKRDGSQSMYPIHPSNVMITELTDDKRRVKTKAPQGDNK